MASPQTENGYTRIANEILEELCRVRLSTYETRVLWFIIRKTYGHQKKMDRISLSQFSGGTGIEKSNARRAIRTLIDKRMVTTEREGFNQVFYGIQKDYDQWKGVSVETVSKETLSGKTLSGETKNIVSGDYERVSLLTPTKERKKKESMKDKFFPIVDKTISRLNELSGKHYRPNSKNITKNLRAQLKEGFTETDFLLVVDDRWQRWKNKPDMLQHFNPDTLFRPSKFELYLTEAKDANGRGGEQTGGGFVG